MDAAVNVRIYVVITVFDFLNDTTRFLGGCTVIKIDKWFSVNLVAFIRKLLPQIESLTENLSLQTDFQTPSLAVKGNRTLLESLMNNLIVNAIRHNYPNGEIIISINEGSLTVSNTSPNESALDVRLIFNRFYRTSENIKGYGLGLAIVKAICEYHQWEIKYIYYNKLHHFRILF